MATKGDLEARQAVCKTVEDYCLLALEALTEPKDEAYAKELLDSAESDCSFPKDYICVAEVYIKAGNLDSADEMYEEAEGACFEPMEIAMLGHSLAVYKGDKEKAKELLTSAAKDAKKVNEILTIAKYINDDIADAGLSKELLGKVEGQLKSLKDYKELVQTIIRESGDKATAKEFFNKASKKVDGIEDSVEYASALVELFDDKESAVKALEEVVDDAQFTKECVMLASGFKKIGDEAKAKELLETGKEFALTGEENIDLAVGYWTLFQDKDASSAGYEKGLNDINDKEKLLGFAKSIAIEIGNDSLAKKYYERAESKMTGAKDLTMLAQAMIDDLKDKEYARGIYERAEKSIETPADLILLAGDIIKNLGDNEMAKNIYRNAMGKINKFQDYLELFDNVISKTDDKIFGKEILVLASEIAGSTIELLQINRKITDVLKDSEFSSQILERAEEVVTNLNEMKEVAATVKDLFPDNTNWAKRVDEKLEKREKNQDKYEAYQKRENSAKTFKELRLIVEEMMAELDDKYYAQKLLKSGQDILDNAQFNIENYRKLIQSIAKYLDDGEWINNILNNLIDNRAKFFFDYCGICHLAVEEMPDKEAGRKLAESFLRSYEENLDSDLKCKTYNYTDLAKAVNHILGDGNWSIHLLEKADRSGADAYSYAYMGYLAGVFKDTQLKEKFFEQALEGLETAGQYILLAERMKQLNVDISEIKNLYAYGRNLSDPMEKLLWTEGIIDAFEDKDWAKLAYKEISPFFQSGDKKEIFNTSKKIQFEGKFC